jgi:peptidoglycan/LPS O-acetylase OafA/YrhL
MSEYIELPGPDRFERQAASRKLGALPEAKILSNPMPVTGNTEHTAPENRVFYPALDGLRAIAFLMVFFQHYYSVPWGWTGVNVFFVLSGFLITGILFDTRDSPHRARNFYVRRTLRIFPLYYGVFLALLLVGPVVHWKWSAVWVAWPLYLGNFLRFVSPAVNILKSPQELAGDAHLSSLRLPRTELFFGHFWSLCVEEQFYLFWPWVVFWLRSRRTLLWICGTVVVAVPLLRVLAQDTAPAWMLQAELLYRLLPFQLDSLLLGGLVALLWRGAYRERLVQIGRVVAALAGVAAIVYLAVTIYAAAPRWHGGYPYPQWRLTWGLTFVNLLSAALILCCLHSGSWVARALSVRPLRWLGRLSYGAYVLHDIFHGLYVHIIVHLAEHQPLIGLYGNGIVVLFALCGTMLLAWLSFRFLETPFLNLKERFTLQS